MKIGNVKLDFTFYDETEKYSDGYIENDIISYIDNCDNTKNYEQVFDKDNRWPVVYHLSNIRQNILNWYKFKANSEILEIGCGMGAITSVLCDKGKNVTAIELSKQRATACAKKNKDKSNLEIIVGNLNKIELNKKYDYITLIGVLEYSPLYTSSDSPFHTFLQNIKKYLKDDGKLLIAIENKFGMKYWTGYPEDHTGKQFDSITGYKNINNVKTYGKEKLDSILKECGFKYTKFYYPLPDYKFPAVIFSDEYLPKFREDLKYEQYYLNNDEILFDELESFEEVIENDNKYFPFFANSFFIECSAIEFLDNIKYVEYNNKLKYEYRTMKILEADKEYKFNISTNKEITLIDEKDMNLGSEILDNNMYNFYKKHENIEIKKLKEDNCKLRLENDELKNKLKENAKNNKGFKNWKFFK